jgi:hypothetical protein
MNKSSTLTLVALVLGASLVQAQTTTLYSDSFSGAGGLLNGVAVQGGTGAGTLWSANSAFLDNGTISGANEGSALLPFTPVANMQYVLSLAVSNRTDRWIALGFGGTALVSPGANRTNDRFSNDNRGISWMLFRQHLTDATQNVQLFGGLGTGSPITDDNRAIDFTVPHQLQIVLDTTGDGTSFKANFLLDGTSILASPATIARSLSAIQYVGMSFDNSTTATVTFDDFQLNQVPEPATGALFMVGLVTLAMSRRRRD